MLKQRVMTAAIMLLVLSIFLFTPLKSFFSYVCCAISAFVLYEWLSLTLTNEFNRKISLFAAVVFFLASSVCAYLTMPDVVLLRHEILTDTEQVISPTVSVITMLSCLLWLFMMPFIIKDGQVTFRANGVLHSFIGLVTLSATCAALIFFFNVLGVVFLLTFLALIWIADSAAYFGGRFFKGPKLAPTISPGKTISGALSGIAGAVAWLLITAYTIDNSFAASILSKSNWFVLILSGVLLSSYSILGDLYESLIKRRANVKDSGKLLPGHGGFWDRMDSIVAVTPIAYILFIVLTNNVLSN